MLTEHSFHSAATWSLAVPQAAKAFLKHFQIPAGVKVIAIGPVTGKALREAGVIPYMTGNSYDIPGILKGLTEEKTR